MEQEAKLAFVETLQEHVKELRTENERLREENERLRSVVREDGLGLGLAFAIEQARSFLKF